MDTFSLENYLASLQRMAERYFRQLNEVFEPNSERQHNKESIEGAGANASAAASDTRERLNNIGYRNYENGLILKSREILPEEKRLLYGSDFFISLEAA